MTYSIRRQCFSTQRTNNSIMHHIFQNTALIDFKAVWNGIKTKMGVQLSL
jgi:hypothetical protein